MFKSSSRFSIPYKTRVSLGLPGMILHAAEPIPEILQELKASYGPEEEMQEGEEDKAEGTDYESVEEEEETEQGMGIKYLPSDKKGLTDRLRLLLAERQAGNNVSTTPEIVAILDALLQMGEINRTQYNTLCKTLKC